jgi:hypothetical protein
MCWFYYLKRIVRLGRVREDNIKKLHKIGTVCIKAIPNELVLLFESNCNSGQNKRV